MKTDDSKCVEDIGQIKQKNMDPGSTFVGKTTRGVMKKKMMHFYSFIVKNTYNTS